MNWVMKLGSILVTPLLVFMSTSLDLFFVNQSFLVHIEYLYPFLGLCVGVYGLGLGLYWVCGRFKKVRWVMGLYYSFPIYFFMNAHFMKEENHIGEWNLLILMVGVLVLNVWVIRRFWIFGFRKFMEGFLGVFGILLLVYEGVNFGYRYEGLELGEDMGKRKEGFGEFQKVIPSDRGVKKGVRKDLPNIYHIVLDAFQTDYFEAMLEEDSGLEEEFEGFMYYPHNISGHMVTKVSLPIMFQGRYPLLEEDWESFVREAFRGDGGFLSDLKRAGYTRYNANLAWNYPRQFDYELKQDNFFKNIEKIEKLMDMEGFILILKDESFIQFWINQYIPFIVKEILMEYDWILDVQFFQTMNAGVQFIVGKEVVKEGFRKVLPRNGYYYIHIPIPHYPYFLESDCNFTGQFWRGTYRLFDEMIHGSMLEQAKCAMRIVMEYLRELRDLKRYDESVIVIQGDHGSHGVYFGKNERDKSVNRRSLEFDGLARYYRSRALLLIKPPVGVVRKEGGKKFRISGKRSHLLDVAPTVLKAVGLSVGKRYEGESLLEDEEDDLRDRKRYFYDDFDKGGKSVLVKYGVDEFGKMEEVRRKTILDD